MQNHKRKAQCLSYDKTLTTIALGPLENKKKKKNAKWRFFTSRARKLRYYGDAKHSFDWKSVVEHDGGVLNA